MKITRLERSKNTKRNMIVGEIDRITGILLPFFVRTMIIHMIGAEYLGLTSLFYSIVQMLNLTEMGFGTAIVYSMYVPVARNDREMVNSLLSFYSKVYRIVGTAVAAAGLLLIPFLPGLIRDETPDGIHIYGLYLIYLANAVAGYFIFPERKALLTAHQRDDLGGRIHIFTQFFMYAAQAVIVALSQNYYLYAAMLPAASVCYSLLCARQAKRKYPAYTGGGKIREEQRREIQKQVAGLTIRKAAVMSRNSVDSIFISAFLGLEAAAVYANYYYIMDSIVMVLAVIRVSMAGGVGNSIAVETKEKNLKDMGRIDFLFMWVSGWCAICLLCLYQPFMELWAGRTMVLPFSAALLFALYFYVLKMSDIRTLYSESAGVWWQARYISVAEAGANLLLNWLFVRSMGIIGILSATLVSYFLFNFIGGAVVLFRTYFTEGGIRTYFLSHARYGAVTMTAAAVTYIAVSQVHWEGIPGLMAKALVCGILPHGIFYGCYRRTKEMKESRPLIEALIRIRW